MSSRVSKTLSGFCDTTRRVGVWAGEALTSSWDTFAAVAASSVERLTANWDLLQDIMGNLEQHWATIMRTINDAAVDALNYLQELLQKQLDSLMNVYKRIIQEFETMFYNNFGWATDTYSYFKGKGALFESTLSGLLTPFWLWIHDIPLINGSDGVNGMKARIAEHPWVQTATGYYNDYASWLEELHFSQYVEQVRKSYEL